MIILAVLAIAALGGLVVILLKGLGMTAAVIAGIILLLALVGIISLFRKPKVRT